MIHEERLLRSTYGLHTHNPIHMFRFSYTHSQVNKVLLKHSYTHSFVRAFMFQRQSWVVTTECKSHKPPGPLQRKKGSHSILESVFLKPPWLKIKQTAFQQDALLLLPATEGRWAAILACVLMHDNEAVWCTNQLSAFRNLTSQRIL